MRSPVVSGSAWRSHVPSSASHGCCCWTEITSGLDVLNRRQVMDLIRTTMGGITTFAAGHGHFGIDIADLVLVLDQGRLVEFGLPAEVRRRSALFRSLVAA